MKSKVLMLIAVLFVAIPSMATVDPTDLAPVVTDRETVENVMDGVQPFFTFWIGSTAVVVGWNNGASVPSVKTGGTPRTFVWYDVDGEKGYRSDAVSWLKLSFHLGKNLVPVLTIRAIDSGFTTTATSAGNGWHRQTATSVTGGLGGEVTNPDSIFLPCLCGTTGNGNGCDPGRCDTGWACVGVPGSSCHWGPALY